MGYSKNTPKYEWGRGWEKKEISDKQAAYILILAEKNNCIVNFDGLSRGSASSLIDDMKYYFQTSQFKRDWIDTGRVEVK